MGGPTPTHEGFMKSLRVTLLLAGLLLLSATTLRAQATRIACKDGSPPKAGHFTCWGHGGVVPAPLGKSRRAESRAGAHTHAAKRPSAKRTAAKKKARAKTAPRHSAK